MFEANILLSQSVLAATATIKLHIYGIYSLIITLFFKNIHIDLMHSQHYFLVAPTPLRIYSL